MDPTLAWIETKFAAEAGRSRRPTCAPSRPATTTARRPRALPHPLPRPPAKLPPGHLSQDHRQRGRRPRLRGRRAAGRRQLFYGSYPITPASDILHQLPDVKHFGVRTFQAEDEIAAIGAAIGASFGGALGLTATSGPGICAQERGHRPGRHDRAAARHHRRAARRPSTGLPTKTEQADLLQAMFGRNGEVPGRRRGPGHARRTASTSPSRPCASPLKYMTPVIFLSDGYLATGSEPWRIPEPRKLPPISVPTHTDRCSHSSPTTAIRRRLARPWAVPGTPGLEHRIGGLEKADVTGNVTYDPDNHERMTALRAQKVAGIANDIPDRTSRAPSGRPARPRLGLHLRRLSTAAERLQRQGTPSRHAHLRYLNPFPRNLGEVLGPLPARPHPRDQHAASSASSSGAATSSMPWGSTGVRGKPFPVPEVEQAARLLLGRSLTDGPTRDHGARPQAPWMPSARGYASPIALDAQGLRLRPGGRAGARGCGDYSILGADAAGHARLRRTRARTSSSSPASAAPADCRTT